MNNDAELNAQVYDATGIETDGRQILFESLFARSADPWNFEASWYESRKRDLVLGSLPWPRYASAFEPGCAAGFVSERLAQRCDRLLASDASGRAVDHARRRLATFENVRVEYGCMPAQWPRGRFDLIVLGELLYYLSEQEIEQVADRCRATALGTGPRATIAACHWLHPFEGFPLGGAHVHELFHRRLGLPRVIQYSDADFCLAVWCTDTYSPAQAEGRRPPGLRPGPTLNS